MLALPAFGSAWAASYTVAVECAPVECPANTTFEIRAENDCMLEWRRLASDARTITFSAVCSDRYVVRAADACSFGSVSIPAEPTGPTLLRVEVAGCGSRGYARVAPASDAELEEWGQRVGSQSVLIWWTTEQETNLMAMEQTTLGVWVTHRAAHGGNPFGRAERAVGGRTVQFVSRRFYLGGRLRRLAENVLEAPTVHCYSLCGDVKLAYWLVDVRWAGGSAASYRATSQAPSTLAPMWVVHHLIDVSVSAK